MYFLSMLIIPKIFYSFTVVFSSSFQNYEQRYKKSIALFFSSLFTFPKKYPPCVDIYVSIR